MHNNGDPSQNWSPEKGNHEYAKTDACCTDNFNTFKCLRKKHYLLTHR